MAPLHVATLTIRKELPKYLTSTLPLYQEWNHPFSNLDAVLSVLQKVNGLIKNEDENSPDEPDINPTMTSPSADATFSMQNSNDASAPSGGGGGGSVDERVSNDGVLEEREGDDEAARLVRI